MVFAATSAAEWRSLRGFEDRRSAHRPRVPTSTGTPPFVHSRSRDEASCANRWRSREDSKFRPAGSADACGNEVVASWNHHPDGSFSRASFVRISLTGAHNDSARHGRSSRGIGSSCGIVGCEPRNRANDDAVGRKAGDKLQHVGRRDLRQRRSDVEFHGNGKKRDSAICWRTCQFGCADRAERRQADGSSPRLPSGFEA
jgi:hypothetical protein